MPYYVYRCSAGHIEERFSKIEDKRPCRIRCKTCKLYARRALDLEGARITASGGFNGRKSVYWPNKEIGQGRWIRNCASEPVYVQNKDEYRNLLKKTDSIERG